MSLQKKCLTASAITHGLLVLLVFVGSAFIPHKPKLEGPEFEIFTLPPDFELVAQDNVFSGGDPNARKGSGVQPPAPQPQPRQEPKQEIPVTKPPERKAEPKVEPKQPEKEKIIDKPKPVVDPEAFDLSKAKAVKPKTEPKTTEPKIDFNTIKLLSQKKTITTSGSDAKVADKKSNTDTKVALNTGAIADMRKKLESGLSPGGSPAGRGDVNDILGPGGARVASYSLYLAGIYRDAWVSPTKSSARTPVRVRVTISRDGVVLDKRVISRSGNREFDRAADDTVGRVTRFDRPPPTNEPSVTYTLEFTPPE